MAELDTDNTTDPNIAAADEAIEAADRVIYGDAAQAEVEPTEGIETPELPQQPQASAIFPLGLEPEPSVGQPPTKKSFKDIIRSKKFFIPALIILFAALILVGLSDVKYSLASSFIKKDIIVEIVDDSTLQPIAGAAVEVAGDKATTDKEGLATLKSVSTGKHTFKITKAGFDTNSQDMVVRFTTARLQPIKIVGNGYELSFVVKNLISGKRVQDAKLTIAGIDATTNAQGESIIRVPFDNPKASLTTSKDGFKDVTQEVDVVKNAPIKEIALSPTGSAIYVSNKSGKYDVYAADYDGQNERVVLAAKGTEGKTTTLYPSPNGEYAALVASREGVYFGYGNYQDELYLLNVATGDVKKIGTSPGQVSWSGDTIVATVVQDNSAQVVAYKAVDGTNKVLLKEVYATGTADGKVYYSLFNPNEQDYGLYSIKIDGSDKKKVYGQPYTTLFLKSITTLGVVDPDTYLVSSYDFAKGTVEKGTENADAIKTVQVTPTKDGKRVIATKQVGDTLQLVSADPNGANEKQLTSGVNVSGGFYITTNGEYIVFYGAVGVDTGVFALSIDGGSTVKIATATVATPVRN